MKTNDISPNNPNFLEHILKGLNRDCQVALAILTAMIKTGKFCITKSSYFGPKSGHLKLIHIL